MKYLFNSGNIGKRDKNVRIIDVLPYSAISTINAITEKTDKIAFLTSMLTRFSKLLTNKIVVLENNRPIGTIGNLDILEGVYKNPTFDFFTTSDIMPIINNNYVIVKSDDKLLDLLIQLKEKDLDFAIVENNTKGFSSFTIEKILQLGILTNSHVKISDIPIRNAPSFRKTDTINDVISAMLFTQCDIMTLENASLFVTAESILDTIQNGLKHNHELEYFMNTTMLDFNLQNSIIVSDNTTLLQACKIMLNTNRPYITTSTRILTTHDIVWGLCM